MRRLPRTYAAYTVPYLALLYVHTALFSPLESVGRYTVVLFPCVIAAATALSKRPRLLASWLSLSLGLETVLFVAWTHWRFVG